MHDIKVTERYVQMDEMRRAIKEGRVSVDFLWKEKEKSKTFCSFYAKAVPPTKVEVPDVENSISSNCNSKQSLNKFLGMEI